MRIANFLERRSKLFWGVAGIVLVFLLGVADYISGHEVDTSLFYLIPIFLVAWYADGELASVMSGASAIAWFIADYSNGLTYSHPSIYIWNAVLRLIFYVIVSWLSTALKRSNKINLELARVDYVTGAASIRYFYELAKIEIGRSERYKWPFTFVYIDLDNFKEVNDRLGHSTGDRVLRAVTNIVQQQIRSTDSLGRLGGDEFALLLPETGEEEARKVITRIHTNLANEMLRNGWMVTFSVGVVTYNKSPKSVDDMVKLADSTMYRVKTNGKNGVTYCVYAG